MEKNYFISPKFSTQVGVLGEDTNGYVQVNDVRGLGQVVYKLIVRRHMEDTNVSIFKIFRTK